LLLGQALQLVLSVSVLILPAVESSGARMAHQIEHEFSLFLNSLACCNPVFPLVEGFGHNLEFTVLEE
jgi:hypothetical protein